MKKVIVTGATGFIGGALCKYLAEQGIEVIALRRHIPNDVLAVQDRTGQGILTHIRYVKAEMKDYPGLPKLISDRDIDVFYHLGWGGVSGPERANYKMQLDNIRYTLEAVHAAKEIGCDRFVGIGSLAEEDIKHYAETDGATPNDVSIYASAKMAAQYMSKAECAKIGLQHIWARPGNVYGEGDKSNNFVNFCIRSIKKGEARFTTGEQLYDFVHITDVAEALYAIGEKGKNFHAYYIGSGTPRKLKDYIMEIRDCVLPGSVLHLGAIPFHGVSLTETDYECTKIYKDTGFRPKMKFSDGIRMLVSETESARRDS